MKVMCQKSTLLSAINNVSRAVASNSTMDLLECILIESIDDDRIRLTANDTELGIETKIESQVLIPGKIALKARLFSDMIKKLPDSEVMIESDDFGKTFINCEHVHFTLMGLAGDDFTRLPEISRDRLVKISQFDLKEVIRQTIFSASVNANNKVMTGELFHIEDNVLTVTALDGHRIAVRKLLLSASYEPVEVIVPGKTLSEIMKILPGEADRMVNIFITDRHILFEMDETIVVSRLLQGKFYDLGKMISADFETRVTVNKIAFLQCLDRATLFTTDSEKRPIILQIEDDVMNMRINSPIGQMNDKLDIGREGKEIRIGFDPKFLVDVLRVVDEEDISLYMMNPIAPCIIKNDEESYFYLILPINVNN